MLREVTGRVATLLHVSLPFPQMLNSIREPVQEPQNCGSRGAGPGSAGVPATAKVTLGVRCISMALLRRIEEMFPAAPGRVGSIARRSSGTRRRHPELAPR